MTNLGCSDLELDAVAMSELYEYVWLLTIGFCNLFFILKYFQTHRELSRTTQRTPACLLSRLPIFKTLQPAFYPSVSFSLHVIIVSES